MITLLEHPCVLTQNTILPEEAALKQGFDVRVLCANTLAAHILSAHNHSQSSDLLKIRFDALVSHDITYVGIIQTARASGLTSFPLPYVLTNCHNSLCAVGGTINEDDHRFGLSCAHKYGGIYVPANLAVIHQYAREALVQCGGMILGSDSHTRYGALGVMGIGEGGPELVKQLLQKTYDVQRPRVILVWLEGEPAPGTGPQDVALALIAKVFKSGFVKNAILEFHGPGIANLSMEFRIGIDVMTTETTCLSSIWQTDATVCDYYTRHGRKEQFKTLEVTEPCAFDGAIRIDLAKIPPMIALPFHPSNAFPISEVVAHANDYLASVEEEAQKQYGELGKTLALRSKACQDGIQVDQAVIAGCAGGSYENIALAAEILKGKSTGCKDFSLSVYPASMPVAHSLVADGSYATLMESGVVLKNCFCGPCFGAGDTPANGALSIRHSTRNFPNREGSKPGTGQLSCVALMDARSIAATAANGGKLTSANDLNWEKLSHTRTYTPDLGIYAKRVYNGFGQAQPKAQLIFGPNITDWPKMPALPKHLLLQIASVILDPVTTTDELIPSGETSSLRSNPQKLSEYTLSRKDPGYVARAKAFQEYELARENHCNDSKLSDLFTTLFAPLVQEHPEFAQVTYAETGFGTTVCARKPGDGSAREQAASCQKVLGGWANIAEEYATKRYRSNLINWGLIPFCIAPTDLAKCTVGAYVFVPHIAQTIDQGTAQIQAYLLTERTVQPMTLTLKDLTKDEAKILRTGCLINFYQERD